jgi:hypothetical protein
MKISEISVLRRTRASAGVFRTPAESINVGRSVRSIQTTIRRMENGIDALPRDAWDPLTQSAKAHEVVLPINFEGADWPC